MLTRNAGDPFNDDENGVPPSVGSSTARGDDSGELPLDFADLPTMRLLPLEAREHVARWLREWVDYHHKSGTDLLHLAQYELRRIQELARTAADLRARLLQIASIAAPLRTQHDVQRIHDLQGSLTLVEQDIRTLALSLADHERERVEHNVAAARLEHELRTAPGGDDDPDGMGATPPVPMPSPR